MHRFGDKVMLVKNHSFVHILLPNKHLWKTVAKIFSLCFFFTSKQDFNKQARFLAYQV